MCWFVVLRPFVFLPIWICACVLPWMPPEWGEKEKESIDHPHKHLWWAACGIVFLRLWKSGHWLPVFVCVWVCVSRESAKYEREVLSLLHKQGGWGRRAFAGQLSGGVNVGSDGEKSVRLVRMDRFLACVKVFLFVGVLCFYSSQFLANKTYM